MDWNQLAGPAALAIAASAAVVALWREHVRSDRLKDETIKTLTAAVDQIPGALGDLTAVVRDVAQHELNRTPNERRGDRR